MKNMLIEWVDRGREPQSPPDPEFPNGRTLDATGGRTPFCDVVLPYPARRCGYFVLRCQNCDMSVVITTAGRQDDPRSVKLACLRKPTELASTGTLE